jgi:hypothetical protein
LLAELQDLPETILVEVTDFVRFLKSQRAHERLEPALLSETSLGKDWLLPEENSAWRDL